MMVSGSIYVAANGLVPFFFFLWLSNIPVCVCVCVCVRARARARVPRLLYPFTCQWRVDVWVLRVLAVVGSAAVNMGGGMDHFSR